MNRKISLISNLFFGIIIVLLISACQRSPGPAANGFKSSIPTIDILYLNHAPVLEVLKQVDLILTSYGNQIKVNRYDIDTPEGAAFAKLMGITEHMPLVIYLNGSATFDLDGQKITFESFPQGDGTAIMAAGSWTISNLEAALKEVTGK